MSRQLQQGKVRLTVLCLLVGVVGRLIPHVPNVTPLTSLSLFSGAQLPRRWSLLLMVFTLLVSDFLLARFLGYPFLGAWSFFTYTGFAVVVLIGSLLPQSPRLRYLAPYMMVSSFGFWVWTNLGVWFTSGLYPKSFEGLLACYWAALPFLRNGVLGDLAWMVAIFGAWAWIRRPGFDWKPRGLGAHS